MLLHSYTIFGLLILLVTSNLKCNAAFIPCGTPTTSIKQNIPNQYHTSTVPLHAVNGSGGLFGQGSGGGFNNIFGNKSSVQSPRTILEIPAKNVKIGALRFLLQIHLVGEQNKPNPKSWVTRQGDEHGDLQVYYQDGTGMLSIQFQEYMIRIQRYGERPSLQYQIQESVMLHSILDELTNVAFGVDGDNIEIDKRLLILQDNQGIESARNLLPTRQS